MSNRDLHLKLEIGSASVTDFAIVIVLRFSLADTSLPHP
jgi:hypothetical protein